MILKVDMNILLVIQLLLLVINFILTDGYFRKNEITLLVGDPPSVYRTQLQKYEKAAYEIELRDYKIVIKSIVTKNILNPTEKISFKQLITIVNITIIVVIGVLLFISSDILIKILEGIILALTVLHAIYLVYVISPPTSHFSHCTFITARPEFLMNFIRGPIKETRILKPNIPITLYAAMDENENLNVKISEGYSPAPVSPRSPESKPPTLISQQDDVYITIFNVSRNTHAAERLGFNLRRKYGIRFSPKPNIFGKKNKTYTQTVIYYGSQKHRKTALKIAEDIPGRQSVGRISPFIEKRLKTLGIKEFRNIIILVGDDFSMSGG